MIKGSGNEETEKEDAALDQDSVSEMAPTENDTQGSIGSGSSQYIKDMQRLNNVLKGNGQAFSKARVGPKAGSTTENLRRSHGSSESLGSGLSSGDLSHPGSDPSVNVPKAWGRNARPGNDWLSRINSKSGRFTGDPPKRSPSGEQLIAQSEKRNSKASVDGLSAAGVPLPKSSLAINDSSNGSTPKTSIQHKIPLESKPQWVLNDDDFTGRSLQVSESPPMRIRNATLDRTWDRKLRTLERKDVNHNEAESQRDSDPQLLPYEIERDLNDNSSPERLAYGDKDNESLNLRHRGKNVYDSGQQRGDHDTTSDFHDNDSIEIGEPIPDTPIVVFRQNEEQTRNLKHSRSRRAESHDVLKRLARVSSSSPSPAKELGEASEQPKKSSKEFNNDSEVGETPQIMKPRIHQKTPVITGAWVDQTTNSTPQESESRAILKTPFVTGGWIETPLPTGGRGPPMPTPSDIEHSRELGTNKLGASDLVKKLNTSTPRPQLKSQEALKYTGPPLPKSALEEIINDARSGKLNDTRPDLDSAEEPTLHLGESTIQSLEDLIANDTDYSTVLATSQETSPPTSDPSPSSSHGNVKAQNETHDPQSYTQLLSRLRNLGPSIRASTRQIASLERTFNTTNSTQPVNQLDDRECHEAGEFHDFIWPCPRCNCPGRPSSSNKALISINDGLTTISLTLPRLWFWNRDDWRPRLTYLGVLLFSIYAYLFAENWAQYVITHPFHFSLSLPPILDSGVHT